MGKKMTRPEGHRHLRNHWTMPAEFMSAIVHQGLGADTEVFASPLNVHPDTTYYYSKYERDKVFGSEGDAYQGLWSGVYEFNPE